MAVNPTRITKIFLSAALLSLGLLSTSAFAANNVETPQNQSLSDIKFSAQLPVPAAVSAPSATQLPDRAAVSHYVTPSQMDLSQFPAFPPIGSAQDTTDLATSHQWQNTRTDAQCAAAKAQANETYDSFFGAVSPFGSPTPAAVQKILQRVGTDVSSVVSTVKDRFQRPRPFVRDSTLTPCLGMVAGYSYPSGHATTSHVFGLLLSSLVPQQSAQFMAYADQAALNRVIGGAHYISDVEAGKRLGDSIYQTMQQNQTFTTDLNSLRAYIK